MQRLPILCLAAATLAAARPAPAEDFDPDLFKQSCDNVTSDIIKRGQALGGIAPADLDGKSDREVVEAVAAKMKAK